jgi:hypothetical protein
MVRLPEPRARAPSESKKCSMLVHHLPLPEVTVVRGIVVYSCTMRESKRGRIDLMFLSILDASNSWRGLVDEKASARVR